MRFFNKYFLLLVFTIVPFLVFAQQKTYKVVCDKTDKKLKVVESTNHSANLVPVKTGFPFAAVARKWIEDNFTTDDCDPGQLMNAGQGRPAPAAPQTTQPAGGQQVTTATAAPVTTPATPAPSYKYNTTFSFGLLYHNLSDVLGLDSNLPGFELSFEQLFGRKVYGGFGVHYNMLLSLYQDDGVVLNNFKFPLIFGYRIHPKRGFIGFEGVFFVNTRFNAITDETFSFRGRIPEDYSLSLYPRIRIGGKVVNFEFGPEFWLNEVFINQDYLFELHMAARFCF